MSEIRDLELEEVNGGREEHTIKPSGDKTWETWNPNFIYDEKGGPLIIDPNNP